VGAAPSACVSTINIVTYVKYKPQYNVISDTTTQIAIPFSERRCNGTAAINGDIKVCKYEMVLSRLLIWVIALFGKEPSGQWKVVNRSLRITKRHEACFVMVKDLAYLIGGRGRNRIDVYDPKRNRWSRKTGPPIELHHMQCVAVPDDNQIYIVSSWTGPYPMEQNVELIYVRIPWLGFGFCEISTPYYFLLMSFSPSYFPLILSTWQIYNIGNDTWTTRDGLPADRRRGGAASVLVGRRIYVSHGCRGGHETGNFSTTYGWLDYYDIDTNTWVTNLPDAPNPRDHTGGGYLSNRYICVAGGRDGGSVGFFNLVILPTDCYDLETNTWSVEANIPQGRAGSAYGTTCDGTHLIVAGGEGFGRAWNNVDLFDGKSWTTLDNLEIARHGTGIAVDCTQNITCESKLYVASGAGSQGGAKEIRSTETYFPNKAVTSCNN
jgi:hypothetical protein